MDWNPLQFALFYASKGWRVFPCRPKDKRPAVKWAQEATIDADKIRAWWLANPALNVGIVTGAQSGLVVLDIDAGKGGGESLLAMVTDHGRLPMTPESLTGGGGRHILFAHPGVEIQNSASKLGPGLDIRGDGGYIVAPPSVHPSGALYQWEESGKPSQVQLAPMPGWLVDLLRTTPRSPNGSEPAAPVEPSGIHEGQRNQMLTSLAGTMRRRGFDTDAILAALMIENEKHCDPPLADDEVENIAKSVGRYAPAQTPGAAQPKPKASAEPRKLMNAYDVGFAFTDLLGNLAGRSVPTFITPIDRALGGLERQTLTILAARPSMGKSTLAWQIARNIAANKLRVLFFSLEMSAVSLWAKAACGACGLRWRDFRAGEATDAMVAQVVDKTMELVQLYADYLLVDDRVNTVETIQQAMAQHRPDLIVVDHLRLVKDENESEVRRLGGITESFKDLSKEYNCATLILAQLNRETEKRDNKKPQLSDLRDSGQIEENADVILMMYREDYYDDNPKPMQVFSETDLLVRKFRDDVLAQRIRLRYDLKEQWFKGHND